eukprot:2396849-Pyramimonas_sp.AAC.1
MAIEQRCDWPSFVTRLAFVPKADGGLRPIALPAAVVRIHGGLRRGIAKDWGMAHDRPYWWASPSKSCDRAVWQQQARA